MMHELPAKSISEIELAS